MFPGQMLVDAESIDETAQHCQNVLSLANSISTPVSKSSYWMIFALFLAGLATPDPQSKARAIHTIRAFESQSIGNHAQQTADLLLALCEEQGHRARAGGRPEEVDWLLFTEARGITIVDFGL